MTVNELMAKVKLTVLAEGDLTRDVKGVYIGDLLSWVMGRAKEDDAWITVMGNLNSIAVAKLADISCIILCESAHLDADAKAQATASGIAILASDLPAYELAMEIGKI